MSEESYGVPLGVSGGGGKAFFPLKKRVFSPENHFFHFILIAILFSSTNIVLILIFYSL